MEIVICDDEASERQLLEKYVREWALSRGVKPVFRFFDSSESFLFSWEDDKACDLLILDIEMGGMSGIELAEKLRAEGSMVPLLFVTGYGEYMPCGYDVSALHYLLKPVGRDKIFSVLDRVREKPGKSGRLCLETPDGVIGVSPEEIWYVEAVGHYCTLHGESGAVQLKESIGSFEKRICGEKGFVKCHRSYLVNLRHVSAVKRLEVLLDSGESIPVSRNLGKQVNQAFISCYRQAPEQRKTEE